MSWELNSRFDQYRTDAVRKLSLNIQTCFSIAEITHVLNSSGALIKIVSQNKFKASRTPKFQHHLEHWLKLSHQKSKYRHSYLARSLPNGCRLYHPINSSKNRLVSFREPTNTGRRSRTPLLDTNG